MKLVCLRDQIYRLAGGGALRAEAGKAYDVDNPIHARDLQRDGWSRVIVLDTTIDSEEGE